MEAEAAEFEECVHAATCGSSHPGDAIKVGRRQLVPDMGPDGPRLLALLSEMSGFWQAFLSFFLFFSSCPSPSVFFTVVCCR